MKPARNNFIDSFYESLDSIRSTIGTDFNLFSFLGDICNTFLSVLLLSVV